MSCSSTDSYHVDKFWKSSSNDLIFVNICVDLLRVVIACLFSDKVFSEKVFSEKVFSEKFSAFLGKVSLAAYETMLDFLLHEKFCH